MNVRRSMLSLIRKISAAEYRWVRLRNRLWPDDRLRILVYHQVCPDNITCPAQVAPWCVSSTSFAEQMKLLADEHYTVLSVTEALQHLESGAPFPPKAVSITFDDGYHNNYTYALPVLAKYGLRATFYLTTRFIDEQVPFDWLQTGTTNDDALFRTPLSWDSVNEMGRLGMTFGSHAHTHPEFGRLGRSQMVAQVVESRRLLAEHVASRDDSFVVPYGVWGAPAAALKDVLQHSGLRGASLGKFGAVTAKTDPFDFPRTFVYGEDSLSTFRQKLAGAYDWFGVVHKQYQQRRGGVAP